MKIKTHQLIISAIILCLPSLAFAPASDLFPYQQAGLTERQAAAHLLSRFTFGAKPGEVDEVVSMGLEKWFQQQLKGGLKDEVLNEKLSSYDALQLSNVEVVAQFPRGPQVRKMAIKDGFISKDSVGTSDRKEMKQQLDAYRKQKSLRDEKELYRQFIGQKILRATYSSNQLHEVLTDFWFNHFNVSATKNQCAPFIPAYERDVIRPNVTDKFGKLLLATAQSPAMLLYLDNFNSTGTNEDFNTDRNNGNVRRRGLNSKNKAAKPKGKGKKSQGLNENYAREVMELHTLGVDGGYTQADVTEAARVLTGWTIYPMKDGAYENMKKMIDKVGEGQLKQKGFVHEGDFLFAINRHDNKEKNVLGKKFPTGGGYKDGVELLSLLAHHPSTARFICKKLAIRFVSDNPSENLVIKMSKTFEEQDGDIQKVLMTMVNSPEFWNIEAQRAKTKSPFEYAISSVRALDADINAPFQLYQWITRMGQKMYSYSAPTGFPDRGQYWINTGSLLNRMNFGLALAAQKIPGIKIDLAALNNHHEPESAEAALPIYAKIMLPERDLQSTLLRLTPLVNSPMLSKNIDEAAKQKPVPTDAMENETEMMNSDTEKPVKERPKKILASNDAKSVFGESAMLSQVVGIIIGSPEFQRR
ncbi:MAG: DUF1800 domain-containing protein [Cyclobacteriaceae bacterium]